MNTKEIWIYIILNSVFIFLTSCKLTWYISFCNETHTETTESNKKIIHEALPNLFQNNLLCAGVDIGTQGSCKGDSGGPLMLNNLATKRWTQIGTVQGAVGMPSFYFCKTNANVPRQVYNLFQDLWSWFIIVEGR